MVGGAVSAGAQPLTVDVVSDVVCPWCYIGKKRLDQAVASLGLPVAVRWRAYQLDPTLPAEGKSRREYLQAKFGSAEKLREVHERLEAAGEADGIRFAFDRIAVSPNTLDAHRLIRWAAETELQDIVVETLFSAYFTEGLDIGRVEILADVAGQAGMDGTEVARRIASDEDRAAVTAEVGAARQAGISGVPTFILANRYAVVGAQPPEAIAEALQKVYGMAAEPQPQPA